MSFLSSGHCVILSDASSGESVLKQKGKKIFANAAELSVEYDGKLVHPRLVGVGSHPLVLKAWFLG